MPRYVRPQIVSMPLAVVEQIAAEHYRLASERWQAQSAAAVCRAAAARRRRQLLPIQK